MTHVPDVFAADGEVGADLAAVDWAAGPLGPPSGWPQSLRTAVSIVLSSRFPMWLAWGPELTFFCNAAYRRDTLGRKYPWALGRPAREVWAEIWRDIGPRIETVLTTGQATWDEELLLLLERSGYPEETYHTFSYSPLRDDAGVVVGMLCVVSEDTDKVIGERRMATLRDLGSDTSVVRTEQQTLAFLHDQLNGNLRDLPFTLTYLFEDDGSARLAGATGFGATFPAAEVWPEAHSGQSVVVQLDKDPLTGLPGGDWPEPPAEALLVPLQQQGIAPYGFLVAGLNRYRPLDEAYRGFVELVAGHVVSGIAGARSYQAQQRRAEELAELDRAKTTFFANISHEFRTPLALIMGPVAELRDRLGGHDPETQRELDLVHRNGLRLGKLVTALLDFSRIEAGRMKASYEPADLAAVTSDLASVFRSAIEKAGLAFEVDCPPLPEPVYIDRGMWEKVIFNLLSNALKFTFDGSVRVSVHAGDGEAVVTVADTGIGVAPEEIPRLFQRFHRIENVRGRSNEGSGIGLALVQELVGLHGGTITADSVESEGTRFTIRLPFGSAHLPADALSAGAGTATPAITADPYVQEALRWLPGEHNGDDPGMNLAVAPSTTTVLIADDNADMREYLARLLTGAGYEVRTVTDGVEALESVRRRPVDLVVSDVMMPRLDGLSLVAALRADRRTETVPVLLLSARAGQEASAEGLRAGADDYLVKPFSAAELLARVRANVDLVRLRTHHVRWRAALIDSLQEAFFVCDEDGNVVEINRAFTDILGYGPDRMPYAPPHPWWPDEHADPEAHRQIMAVFRELIGRERGSHTIPVNHRDGRRMWISVTVNPAEDPDSGRKVVVGTFRDVTAERHAIQRDTALAALSMRMSEATSVSDALAGALDQMRRLWDAERVVAVVFDERDRPTTTSTDPGFSWDDLPGHWREALTALRERPALTTTADGTGIAFGHPDGTVVLGVDLAADRQFTEQDTLLLSLLAAHLAQGLARVHQIDQQRETALALQRALLGPSQLPGGFAVRYEPAARPLAVGGDWYDVVALPDGRIGIVVGDCVGRGLKAAAVMGQLRSACRALLLQQTGPARTLMALDTFAAGIPEARCTTVFCGVLDPETGHLTYSSAGHLPPVLADPHGGTVLLGRAGSVPLAVLPGADRPEADCVVPARATLLVYTDGLVERRRRSLTDGIDQAAAVLLGGRDLALDELATRLMTKLAPAEGYEDDVALLLWRHPVPFDLTFPAEPARLREVRRKLRTWMDRCGLTRETAQGVLVAAGEACTNAIEHGYRGTSPGAIRLRLEATARELFLSVADTGRWRPPQPEADPMRGRGIKLMRAIMRKVTFLPGPDGTTVDMHMRIPG
ncbi:SpoIIE family protein phosphatase [Actinocrispum sp. NPDC049592]|uniref:SpoIIE family protein phosphatase n=1 Tax=Actinocrispum sp. NPDC049592 TaxID=3154835 RepID=UPI00341CD811